MSLIGVLVVLLIVCVVLWAARALIGAFSVPQPIATVVYVIIVLVVVFWFVQALGYGGGPYLRLR